MLGRGANHVLPTNSSLNVHLIRGQILPGQREYLFHFLVYYLFFFYMYEDRKGLFPHLLPFIFNPCLFALFTNLYEVIRYLEPSLLFLLVFKFKPFTPFCICPCDENWTPDCRLFYTQFCPPICINDLFYADTITSFFTITLTQLHPFFFKEPQPPTKFYKNKSRFPRKDAD